LARSHGVWKHLYKAGKYAEWVSPGMWPPVLREPCVLSFPGLPGVWRMQFYFRKPLLACLPWRGKAGKALCSVWGLLGRRSGDRRKVFVAFVID
jgi:hypothetical protein